MNTEQQIQEAEDRRKIREVVDRYAYCADLRDAYGQMNLFTEDTRFEVYYDPKSEIPTQTFHGRESLFPVFDNLNTYKATMHFNGQHTLYTISADKATGKTYTIAHHLTIRDGKQHLMVAYLRYEDEFAKVEEKWYFSVRKIFVAMMEDREW